MNKPNYNEEDLSYMLYTIFYIEDKDMNINSGHQTSRPYILVGVYDNLVKLLRLTSKSNSYHGTTNKLTSINSYYSKHQIINLTIDEFNNMWPEESSDLIFKSIRHRYSKRKYKLNEKNH